MKNIKLYFNTLKHPIGGFTDICEQKAFSYKDSFALLLMLFVSQVIDRQFSGFAFNSQNTSDFNIGLLFLGTLLVVALWSLCNWSVTTLMEGKGKLKQIVTVSLTSTIPYSFSLLLHALLTNILTTDEGIFLEYIMVIGILWTAVLLLCGLIVLHDFTLGRVLWSAFLTVLFMLVIVFLAVVAYSLIQQVLGFISDLFDEISYRV